MHLVDVVCETVIQNLQSVARPVTLRFVDVEAGVVTPHELRDSLQLDSESLAAISWTPGTSGVPSSPAASKQQAAFPSNSSTAPASPRGRPPNGATPLYKIILLGTTGVGKSSLLAVGVHGDDAYAVRAMCISAARHGPSMLWKLTRIHVRSLTSRRNAVLRRWNPSLARLRSRTPISRIRM